MIEHGANVGKFKPPASEGEAISWLQLIRSRRVGPATFLRLINEYGSVADALSALPEIARAAGVTSYTPCLRQDAEREYRAGLAADARLICLGSDEYPRLLAEIADPPPILWARGRNDLLSSPPVAMVGARNASSLGIRMARNLAQELGIGGHTVVSGLARGIDTASHQGALKTGTLAVMAGGIDRIYPSENEKLAHEITQHGLLLSEQPPGLTPQARHFPRRNRIISGVSRAVVVVEAAAKSGSLITARDALDQGREVMAVPGHPMDARAAGCNMLIRDGATLVRWGKDIAEALSALDQPGERDQPDLPHMDVPRSTIPQALDISRRILSLLSPSPIAEDQLIRDLELPARIVSSELVGLELDGKLKRQTGGMLSLVV